MSGSMLSERELGDRYLDLLARSVSRSISGMVLDPVRFPPESKRRRLFGPVVDLLRQRGLVLVRQRPVEAEARAVGRDRPADAETMIGRARLDNFRTCIETVIAEDVAGDIVEAGVWRGGACILAQGVLTVHEATDRQIWLADSFQGLPPPDEEAYPADAGDTHYQRDVLAVDAGTVRANFDRYGLWGENLHLLVGWFRDTLPTAPIEQVAVLRCDGDLYQSTMETLEALEPKVSPGGFIIVDDYGAVPACKQATDDYRRERGIDDALETIDWTGVYWRKSGS